MPGSHGHAFHGHVVVYHTLLTCSHGTSRPESWVQLVLHVVWVHEGCRVIGHGVGRLACRRWVTASLQGGADLIRVVIMVVGYEFVTVGKWIAVRRV